MQQLDVRHPSTIASLLRRSRAALGNAAVWGAGWFGAGLVIQGALALAGGGISGIHGLTIVRHAAQFGVMGAIAGSAFSAFIGWRYRGRRLAELSWLRFGLGGAVVVGLFVPSFIVVMRFLSGDDFLALGALARNGVVGAVLGGAAAAVSLKLAQLADAHLPSGSRER